MGKPMDINRRLAQTESGFTMIEMLVVVAIISVMVGIAVPNFVDWLPDYRLKKPAKELFSNMQLAKLNAIKQNTDWAIVFDSGENKYYICSAKGADNSWAITVGDPIEKEVTLPDKSGVQFGHGSATKDATTAGGQSFSDNDITFGSNYATFNAMGTGNSGYVYLENEKDATYAITKESTGFIAIKKWNGSNWE